jgi:hypothetical protein
MKVCATFFCVFLSMFTVMAEDKTPGVQAFLPLFEKNAIGRKTLDVRYSLITLECYDNRGKILSSGKVDLHLVFDGETGKYREETTSYNKPPNDADVCLFGVYLWDGKEGVEWERTVMQNHQGFRALGTGMYEDPGRAAIQSRPRVRSYMRFCYDWRCRPFSKIVPEQNPRLGNLSESTIPVEVIDERGVKTFEFSKNGTLKRIVSYYPDENNKRAIRDVHEFSNHVECSGFWLPLKIVDTTCYPDGRLISKMEFIADPKELRLLDKIDPSLFSVVFPAGCSVDDEIRKKKYKVTTADTLPTDVDALKQTLENMLEQAQEQKNAHEKDGAKPKK